MAGLIFLWNSNGMGCDVVAMLLVEVVMCWGFMVLILLYLCCNVGNRHKYSFSTHKIKKKIINGAKDFTEYANKIINGTSCLYLMENETIAESQDKNEKFQED